MKRSLPFAAPLLDRRSFLTKAIAAAGASTATALKLAAADAPPKCDSGEDYLKGIEEDEGQQLRLNS